MRFINLELFKIASQDIFDGILGKRAHRRSEIFSRNKRQNKSWSQSVISRREAQKGGASSSTQHWSSPWIG